MLKLEDVMIMMLLFYLGLYEKQKFDSLLCRVYGSEWMKSYFKCCILLVCIIDVQLLNHQLSYETNIMKQFT